MSYKTSLERKLHEIAKTLESKHTEKNHLGVLAGISGISMFFFYYSKYTQSNKYAELGNKLLEESLRRINEGYSLPTYCTGIAGMGWVFDHLVEENFIDIDNDDVLADLEPYLYAKMIQDLSMGYYDFLHGALGHGVYFLKRFKNTNSRELKSRYTTYILTLIKALGTLSEKDNNGLKWVSDLRIEGQPTKRIYNLSLSHGISSIVSFLAKACQYEEFRSTALPLLKGGTDYLLAQETVIDDSLFPSSVYQESEEKPENLIQPRLAWCYGDLGLGISILKAALIIEDEKVKESALRILLHSTKREGLKACGVVDASPCHGAFGIALIYGNLFKATQLKEFQNATNYWIQQGLDLAIYKDGYAGYKQQHWKSSPYNEVNVLEGIAGIGLVILSYLNDFETNWEESLLIN